MLRRREPQQDCKEDNRNFEEFSDVLHLPFRCVTDALCFTPLVPFRWKCRKYRARFLIVRLFATVGVYLLCFLCAVARSVSIPLAQPFQSSLGISAVSMVSSTVSAVWVRRCLVSRRPAVRVQLSFLCLSLPGIVPRCP